MPLYEYRCKTCGGNFEKMMRWSESDRLPECPHCQGQDTQKKVSAFASVSGGSLKSSSSSSCGSSGGFR